MPKRTAESANDEQVMQVISMYGSNAISWKNKADKYTPNGLADITACINGVHYEIETKAGNGHPLGLNQLFFGFKCVMAGGTFIVAYPDFIDVVPTSGQGYQNFSNLNAGMTAFADASQLPEATRQELERMRKAISKAKTTVYFRK